MNNFHIKTATVEAPTSADTPTGAAARWHLLTGEYPPQPGGVADYAALVAAGLAGTGAEVHVWAPPVEAGSRADEVGVIVHREAGRWASADLARLDRALNAFPTPRRLLVQYTPNAWGRKGTNLGFCQWLGRRREAGDQVWTMIHESAYHWTWRDKPSRLALAAVHRVMLHALLKASERVFFSTLAMERRLYRYGPVGRRPIVWLPVMNGVPVIDDPERAAALKRRLAPRGALLIGHFGTFSAALCHALGQIVPGLLRDRPERVALLLGRNGRRFAESLRGAEPRLADRIIATGGLEPAPLSLHLQACDLLIQPYNDGVSTRRSSLMAGLAHGRPIVSNLGINTEPIWVGSGALALAPTIDPTALTGVAEDLLGDPARRARLGADGLAVYERHFALARTIEAMTAD